MAPASTKAAEAAAKRAQASEAREPKSTAKILEEQTGEIESKISKVLERQRDSARDAYEDVEDLIEALQKSHHKEKLEAKRLPNANQSRIRDLEYHVKKLQEDCNVKQALLAKYERSRTMLKAERDRLNNIIEEQRSGVIIAEQRQAYADAALAPTQQRLETLNSIGGSMHTYVIARVMELRRLRREHESADANDKMLNERLEREYNDTTLGLFDGWDRVEQEYMYKSSCGEFPHLHIAAPDLHEGTSSDQVDADDIDNVTESLRDDGQGASNNSTLFVNSGHSEGYVARHPASFGVPSSGACKDEKSMHEAKKGVSIDSNRHDYAETAVAVPARSLQLAGLPVEKSAKRKLGQE